MESQEAQVVRDKRLPRELHLPTPVRHCVAEAEASKRGRQPEGENIQAKFVRFDPEAQSAEPSPRQPRIVFTVQRLLEK